MINDVEAASKLIHNLLNLVEKLEAENSRLRAELDLSRISAVCEFCGDPATRIEKFDRDVPVCNSCSAGHLEPAAPCGVPVQYAEEWDG